MARQRTCPSCKTEKAQQISEMLRQAQAGGGLEQIPRSYHPPKEPWSYLQGFLLGIPVYAVVFLSLASPQSSEAEMGVAEMTSFVALFVVGGGYGILKNKNYTQKMNEWKSTIAPKFLCRKCSHAFEG